MSAWADHAIWWHVYPLGFTGAPPEALPPAVPPQHRLAHLTAWLDYAVDLGATGLLLGPVFASQSHGYDTTDHLRIDSRLGDDGDWDAFAEQARSRGLRLILDGVFNHVGRAHPRFVAALEAGPDSAAGRWFQWRPGPSGALVPGTFEGHESLVALNHAEPEVAEYVAGVLTHWLDRGAAGWRLDAAYAVPAAFWRQVLPAVRAAHPHAWVVGEMIHGDYAGYVADSGIDSVTQYELWKALWSAVVDRNFFELAWALQRHGGFTEAFVPLTFAGNHDVTRIASRITDPRHVLHVVAVLFLVAGVPAVYAGDEQGFRGVKEERVGGDDAVRPTFPATPAALADDGWPRYREHRRLAALRRDHPWLAHARTTTLHVANEQLVLASDSPDGAVRLVLALNLADAAFTPPVPLGERLLASADQPTSPPGTVGPHAWAVYRA